jgi:para-aminobenzoate synthetase / 4-amino-4-deoxychorismate lyase
MMQRLGGIGLDAAFPDSVPRSPLLTTFDAPSGPCVLIEDGDRFLLFEKPLRIIEARDAATVVPALERADAALARGHWVAGFLAYEAAAAFGLATRDPDPDGPPLLWLGVFDAPSGFARPSSDGCRAPSSPWQAALDGATYASIVERLHEHIAAGDTYQLNLTFPLTADLAEEPFALFSRLLAAARPAHAAYVDIGRFAIVSTSPELFFRRHDGLIEARPMKGTAPRGRTPDEDQRCASALRGSDKERAENLMIVDMMRNDLGRVAEVGSVAVTGLFEVERYPTLLQMTSTVIARSRAPFSALMAALFPCASVTGAPKKRTMAILKEREVLPRGIYTGTIGCAGPDGDAHWNVAIRTAVADRRRGLLSYGVGSGIVADSTAASEYAECLLKAQILEQTPFALLETMAFLPGEGFRQLDEHLARLTASAAHFCFPFDRLAVRRVLDDLGNTLTGSARVRLLLHADGGIATETALLPALPTRPVRVGLASRPVTAESIWLYHKTTRRDVYASAQASRPDCDEVLLWNDRGEITESTIANVLVEREGQRVTPPVSSGLLPGVERARLLDQDSVRVAIVRVSDLTSGSRIWLVNSLRGVREGVFVG